MNTVQTIITRFGGIRPLARALGLPASTVQSWRDRNLIPARRQIALLAHARAVGIELEPADFFDLPTDGSAA